MKKNIIICIILATILIILNPKISAAGVANGLSLWLNTVIPALFPFMIISNFIVSYYADSFKRPTIFAMVMGLFCGYPVCASITSELLRKKIISQNNAQFIVNTCNVASPMFAVAYVIGYGLDNNKIYITLIYVSVLINALIQYAVYKPIRDKCIPSQSTADIKEIFLIIDNSLAKASETLIKIGGYIIMFSMMAAFIQYVPFQNICINSVIISLLEITTGIDSIVHLKLSLTTKASLIIPLCQFGGLCTFMQTACVTRNSSISLLRYLAAKIVMLIISLIIIIFYKAI